MLGSSWVSLAALALLAAALCPQPTGGAADVDEAAIMQALRQARHDTNASWDERFRGWTPGDPIPHCQWTGVRCDAYGRVSELYVGDRVPSEKASRRDWAAQSSTSLRPAGDSVVDDAWPGVLLPELARLQRLKKLSIWFPFVRFRNPMPDAWGAPGAFPRLQDLTMDILRPGPALPDLQPGALPRLNAAYLTFPQLLTPLPASWGAHPGVLPALAHLSLSMRHFGGLPPQWAVGFAQLRNLILSPSDANVVHTKQVPPLPGAEAEEAALSEQWQPLRVPPEWADAGFPCLETLHLSEVRLNAGKPTTVTFYELFPQAGFPALKELSINQVSSLAGTLPPLLFKQRPTLTRLSLSYTSLTGQLPAEWGASNVELLDIGGGHLTGPAFPPAWLEPGAMPALKNLALEGNRNLTGTLPAHLSWPQLETLNLDDTGLHGTIPAAWCKAPIAQNLALLSLVGVNVDLALPPCFKVAVPGLVLNPTRRAGQPPPAKLPSAGLIGLAVLLMLGTAVAAGAAGRVLLQYRLRQRHRGTEGLHQEDEQGRLLASEVSSSQLAVDNTRRAQMSALIRDQLGQGISMLQLEKLPVGLTHRMVPNKHAGATHGSGLAGSIELQQLLTPAERRSSGLPREAVEDWVASASSTAAGLLHDHLWRLDTRSMQLKASELEFVIDARGDLVVLGVGSTGVVYLARLQGFEVALKVVELAGGTSSRLLWQEAALLRRCTHDRIIPLYGVALQGNLLMLAMELMEGGTLQSALQNPEARDKLRWDARGRQIAVDVTEAVCYLHQQMGIMHSDICARNVLLSGDCRAFLGDLGLGLEVAGAARTAVGGSTLHAAPELLLGQRVTLAADLYSLGILLIALLTQEPVTRRGGWRLPRSPQECPQEVVELIQECISQDAALRPSAAQALARLQAAAERKAPDESTA